MPNLPDPRDFTIRDEWNRELRYFVKDDKFYRLSPDALIPGAPGGETRELNRLVYAGLYLNACLAVPYADDLPVCDERCSCGREYTVYKLCPVCDRDE